MGNPCNKFHFKESKEKESFKENFKHFKENSNLRKDRNDHILSRLAVNHTQTWFVQEMKSRVVERN